MHIAVFQQWVKDADDETQWNCLATLQILSHLTEEVGELARSINRIYGYVDEKEEHLAGLGREVMDVFWFLVKIANRFNVDLDAEAEDFLKRASTWSPATREKYRKRLIASLRTLDEELTVAKGKLHLA